MFAEEARSNFQPGWLRRLKRFADHNHASRRISKRIHGNDQAQGDYGNVMYLCLCFLVRVHVGLLVECCQRVMKKTRVGDMLSDIIGTPYI
jgi:hypothetical protein